MNVLLSMKKLLKLVHKRQVKGFFINWGLRKESHPLWLSFLFLVNEIYSVLSLVEGGMGLEKVSDCSGCRSGEANEVKIVQSASSCVRQTDGQSCTRRGTESQL